MKTRTRIAALLAALLTLCLCIAGCSPAQEADPGEDPMAGEEVIDVSVNEAINSFLNQYNLDAEYRISNEDCSDATSTSVDAKIGDVVMRV